jgi:hypothetical protein
LRRRAARRVTFSRGAQPRHRQTMPAALPSTPRSYVCDCTCLSGEALRARHANALEVSAGSLLTELHHIIFSNASATRCAACPTLMHFRALFLEGGAHRRAARLRALESVVQGHYRRHPCVGTVVPPHVCIGVNAWRIMRATTLMSDLAALSACQGEGVRRARATIKRCRAAAAAPSGNASHPNAEPSASFAHFQLYHAAVRRGKSYTGQSYWALALDDPPLSECDLVLSDLAPSLKRYHSGVLGENAGAMALGFAAHCLLLPPWLSIASWKQDQKGKAPLPCGNLTAAPFDALPVPSKHACGRPGSKTRHAVGSRCGSGSSSGRRGGGAGEAHQQEDVPTAFIYSHWNPHYPRQDIRPAWEALYREELNASFSTAELKHLARIGSTGLRSDTPASVRQVFSGATHPCCSYFVAPQASFRALAKLHALLLARVYLQEMGVADGEGAAAGVGDGLGGLESATTMATTTTGTGTGTLPATTSRNATAEPLGQPRESQPPSDASSKDGSKTRAKPWWGDRAFAWARNDWAQIDLHRGCWGFEGRGPSRIEGKHYGVPRNEGALSYLGEVCARTAFRLHSRPRTHADPPWYYTRLSLLLSWPIEACRQ